MSQHGRWEIIYRRAWNEEENTYFFPERLGKEALEDIKKTQGSYMFANQYQNEIIPLDAQTFKREWIKYYNVIPEPHFNFIAVDPALSEADSSDSTGVVVVAIDTNGTRYVRAAERLRLNPTQVIKKIFELNRLFKPMAIGIEEVAYQKALIHFLSAEMVKRNDILPLKAIKHPTQKSKQMRILSMVPYFEWSRIFLNQGLKDLEKELTLFPRGAHDDLIDALQMIDYIATTPQENTKDEKPHYNSPEYEKWYIRTGVHKKNQSDGNLY